MTTESIQIKAKRKRTGAIARLPKEIRDHINSMLDEGHTYKEIVEYLCKQGFENFNINSISRWRYSGYQDWVEHHERTHERMALQRWAASMSVKKDKTVVSRALTNFSAARLHNLLARIDVNRLAEELASRPQYVARLFNTLLRTSKMSRDGAIAFAEIEPENHNPPGLSDKTRRKLERALRLK
jgi:hypothetical protein